METEGMIDVTNADIKEIVRAAYDLSVAQGLGVPHYREGGLSDDEVSEIIDRESAARRNHVVASMDYVNGRAVKLTVFRDKETDKQYIRDSWFDHSESQLAELLKRIGVITC